MQVSRHGEAACLLFQATSAESPGFHCFRMERHGNGGPGFHRSDQPFHRWTDVPLTVLFGTGQCVPPSVCTLLAQNSRALFFRSLSSVSNSVQALAYGVPDRVNLLFVGELPSSKPIQPRLFSPAAISGLTPPAPSVQVDSAVHQWGDEIPERGNRSRNRSKSTNANKPMSGPACPSTPNRSGGLGSVALASEGAAGNTRSSRGCSGPRRWPRAGACASPLCGPFP